VRHEMATHYYQNVPHGVITYKQADMPEHVGVLDIERGHFSQAKPFVWQTDDRLEDNVTWCMVQEPKYRSAASVLHQLIDIVSKNGVLLLNVGPYADGSFHPEAVRVLYEVGDWLHTNGEAIYGSRPWLVAMEGGNNQSDSNFDVNKIKKQIDEGLESTDSAASEFTSSDFRFTQKDGSVYAMCLGQPTNGSVLIQSVTAARIAHIESVCILGCDANISFERTDAGLTVIIPENYIFNTAMTIKIN